MRVLRDSVALCQEVLLSGRTQRETHRPTDLTSQSLRLSLHQPAMCILVPLTTVVMIIETPAPGYSKSVGKNEQLFL